MEKLACVKKLRAGDIYIFIPSSNFNLVFFITKEQNEKSRLFIKHLSSVSADCRDISGDFHCLKILRDTPSQISYVNSKESRSVDVIALVLRFHAKMSQSSPGNVRLCRTNESVRCFCRI